MIEKQPIKSYVLRSGRMSIGQKIAYNELKDVHCIGFEKKLLNFDDTFTGYKNIYLEIGFGMGDVTHRIAEENPQNAYLGIEVHSPGVGKLLREIESKDLKNLKIIEHDAVEVLNEMIAPRTLKGIHIFFPDPWQKAKHKKRRLIDENITKILLDKLESGAYIYAVSDWQDYADQILEVFTNTKGIANKYDKWAEPQEWRSTTKFESKGLRKNHSIREIFFIKE